jgi:hypothetical protein
MRCLATCSSRLPPLKCCWRLIIEVGGNGPPSLRNLVIVLALGDELERAKRKKKKIKRTKTHYEKR